METLVQKTRKSRKNHICNYCGNTIARGETYRYSKYVCDGEPYEWKSHVKCAELARTIWDMADPDEGMTHELFCDTLTQVAGTFICSDCPYHNANTDDCDCALDPECIDHIHEFFKTWQLKMVKPWTWRIVRKGGEA